MADETEGQVSPTPSTTTLSNDELQAMIERAAQAGAAAHAQAVIAAPLSSRQYVTGELLDQPTSLLVEGDHLDHRGMVDKFRQMYPQHPFSIHKQMANAIQARNPNVLAFNHLGLLETVAEHPDAQAFKRALDESRAHWLAVFPPEAPEPHDPTEVELLGARVQQLEAMIRQAGISRQPALAG